MNQCKWCGNSFEWSNYYPLCSKKCRYESDLQEANKETKIDPLSNCFGSIMIIAIILFFLVGLLSQC
jgi:hypothetical protein